MTLLVLSVVCVLSLGIYLVGCLDGHWTLHVRRLAIAVVVALAFSAVVYAAEIRPNSCDGLEKYSFLWYANGCFWYEHSS